MGLFLVIIFDVFNVSWGGNFIGVFVDFINSFNDLVMVYCWFKDIDFGVIILYLNINYYWKFYFNIFG